MKPDSAYCYVLPGFELKKPHNKVFVKKSPNLLLVVTKEYM